MCVCVCVKVLEDYHDGMDKTLNEMKEGEDEEDDEDGCLMSEGELVTEMHSNEQGWRYVYTYYYTTHHS